jgi:hypothetical protein
MSGGVLLLVPLCPESFSLAIHFSNCASRSTLLKIKELIYTIYFPVGGGNGAADNNLVDEHTFNPVVVVGSPVTEKIESLQQSRSELTLIVASEDHGATYRCRSFASPTMTRPVDSDESVGFNVTCKSFGHLLPELFVRPSPSPRTSLKSESENFGL